MCVLLSLITYNYILEIIVKINIIRKESKSALELTKVILLYLEKEIILFWGYILDRNWQRVKKWILKTHKKCDSKCLIIQLSEKWSTWLTQSRGLAKIKLGGLYRFVLSVSQRIRKQGDSEAQWEQWRNLSSCWRRTHPGGEEAHSSRHTDERTLQAKGCLGKQSPIVSQCLRF